MARAMKCDICKKYYEVYGDDKKFPNTLAFANGRYEELSMHILRKYDCCPECMDKLHEFVLDLGMVSFENGSDISNPENSQGENLPESRPENDYDEVKENNNGTN